MGIIQRKLSRSFQAFFNSGKSSSILLIICTIISLILANSVFGAGYLAFWQSYYGGLSVEHWINDALMAIFFLLIGLELERELTTANSRTSRTLCSRYLRQSAVSLSPR